MLQQVSAPPRKKLDNSSSELDRFVAQVDEALSKALDEGAHAGPRGPELLMAAARNLCLAGTAKRARPRLTYLFGQAVGAPTDALVDVAVAGELIHAGSLLHDDVVDEASTRRGRPTANARWNNLVAVLSGDLVLTLAFVQLHHRTRVITREAVDTIAEMSRGVMAEVLARGEVELPLDHWRAIVEGKTGSLFGWCARGAAHLAEDAEAIERFGACGRHLGVAFQLTDDLLDFRESGTGKDRFSDILNREPTFPILTAAQHSKAVRRQVAELWEATTIEREQAEALGQAILATGAVHHTVEAVEIEIARAVDALGRYADRPGGDEVVMWSQVLIERARDAFPS